MSQLDIIRRALKLVGACSSKSGVFLRRVEKDGFEAAYTHAVKVSYARQPFTKRSVTPWAPIDVLNVIGNLLDEAGTKYIQFNGFWRDAYSPQNFNPQYVLRRYPAERLLKLALKAVTLSKEKK